MPPLPTAMRMHPLNLNEYNLNDKSSSIEEVFYVMQFIMYAVHCGLNCYVCGQNPGL